MGSLPMFKGTAIPISQARHRQLMVLIHGRNRSIASDSASNRVIWLLDALTKRTMPPLATQCGEAARFRLPAAVLFRFSWIDCDDGCYRAGRSWIRAPLRGFRVLRLGLPLPR